MCRATRGRLGPAGSRRRRRRSSSSRLQASRVAHSTDHIMAQHPTTPIPHHHSLFDLCADVAPHATDHSMIPASHHTAAVSTCSTYALTRRHTPSSFRCPFSRTSPCRQADGGWRCDARREVPGGGLQVHATVGQCYSLCRQLTAGQPGQHTTTQLGTAPRPTSMVPWVLRPASTAHKEGQQRRRQGQFLNSQRRSCVAQARLHVWLPDPGCVQASRGLNARRQLTVEQRRLAGAAGSHQAGQLPGAHHAAHVLQAEVRGGGRAGAVGPQTPCSCDTPCIILHARKAAVLLQVQHNCLLHRHGHTHRHTHRHTHAPPSPALTCSSWMLPAWRSLSGALLQLGLGTK